MKTIFKGFCGAFLSILFIASCDDDLSSIGGSIQPESDKIYVGVDTIKNISVETIQLDAIHARTIQAMLGKYKDPIFGEIESDYMSQVFPTETASFQEYVGDFKIKEIKIDSVELQIDAIKVIGDTLSPVGVSVYRLTKQLNKDIYTDVDPKEYCDMKDVLGRTSFTIADSYVANGHYYAIKVPLKQSLGHEFLEMWKNDSTIFKDPDLLKEKFKGFYVTQTFGSDVLMTIDNTSLLIYYSFKGPTKDKLSNDSTYRDSLITGPSPEVIQVNRISNNDMSGLINDESAPRSYMKTPAGVYSKFNIPLTDVAKAVGKDTVINSARFDILGFTELEQFSAFDRPTNLLFINKDSIDSFFSRRNSKPDNITSFVIQRNSSSNKYSSTGIIPYQNVTGTANLANLLNYYLDKFRSEDAEIKDLEYVLLPVNVSASTSTDYYNNTISYVNSVTHNMSPTSAILRTNDLKIPYVFTKYKEK